MAAGAVFVATGKRKISELGGLYKQMPVTAVCFLIASLSIAGMPFLNGFVSKGLIMEALHDYTIGYWLVMLAGIGTWLSITMKINYFVFFGKTDRAVACAKVPMHMNVAMIIGTVLCVVTGVLPGLGYSLMPYQTMGHPFTAHHILEYIGLFIGATIPFAVLIKKMAPHDNLSLDFDWFYRKPFAAVVFGLSKAVHGIFVYCENAVNKVTETIKLLLNDPAQVLYNATHWHKDEEEVPIGNFIWIFLLFCVVAFFLVRKIM